LGGVFGSFAIERAEKCKAKSIGEAEFHREIFRVFGIGLSVEVV
jgi:hypothetical protein